MTRNELDALQTSFAPAQIKQREGSFGKTLDYLETHTVIQRLNEALGGNWSFEVIRWEIHEVADEVIVTGRLSTGLIIKEQTGSSKCKRNKNSGELVGIGDDIKAAASDCLKKCATLLGVGLQLYESQTQFGSQQQGSVVVDTSRAHPERRPHIRQIPPHHGNDGNREFAEAGAGHFVGAEDGHGDSGGTHSTSRLSQKQHNYLQQLAQKHHLTTTQLNDYCRQVYGVLPAFLSRQDASQLIDQLQRGGITLHHSGHAA